jgi:protein TonB
VLRFNSLAGTLATLGVSGAVHAAVLLTPLGHGRPGRGAGEVEISVDAAEITVAPPDLPAPEPTVAPPSGHASRWPTHTHPYPVAADHDWTPHDPSLVHPHDAHPESHPTPDAPAQAAPALTGSDSDDAPRFTIAIGTDDDAHGAVSRSGTAPPRDDAPREPLAQEAVDAQARLVTGPAPAYPDAARAEGVEGDVRLELVVGTQGAVESARVVRGIGHGLDEAALHAVRQFRFAPARKAGDPVCVRMAWSIQFRLR